MIDRQTDAGITDHAFGVALERDVMKQESALDAFYVI